MTADDLPRLKQKPHEIGQDLSLLSVAELAERIEILKEEIARLELAKAAKGGAKQVAESIFRK
jgi:uncharacterized small protein (DUF1192 family)